MRSTVAAVHVKPYMPKHGYVRTFGLVWMVDWDTQMTVNVNPVYPSHVGVNVWREELAYWRSTHTSMLQDRLD